jgi:hypothetical protein
MAATMPALPPPTTMTSYIRLQVYAANAKEPLRIGGALTTEVEPL